MKHLIITIFSTAILSLMMLLALPMMGSMVTKIAMLDGHNLGGYRALAQRAKKEKPSKPKTRRSEVLGKAAFKKIEQAQNMMAEEKYVDALEALQSVLDSERFSGYEKAVATQTMGFVYAGQGDYGKTIAAFEHAVNTGNLPPRVVNDLTYNLAQLNLAEERPQKALALLAQWFDAVEGEPAADAFALKAQIHLVLGQLPPAEKAIRAALDKVDAPKQQWVRIFLSVLLQEERYQEARPVLEDAVARWPGVKAFWQQLMAVYYQANEEKLAFAAQRAMHVQNMLTSSKELEVLAQLYLYHDVPIKAAQILQSGMDKGSIEKTEKNYEMLAQAYMHAREWKKSIKPLTVAAQKSDKGKHYEQLAQSYLQNEEWKKAESALEKALEKGGLKSPANSWLLLGIARVRIEKYDAAIKAFRKAGDDDEIATDAFRWIRSIERRLAEQVRLKSDG